MHCVSQREYTPPSSVGYINLPFFTGPRNAEKLVRLVRILNHAFLNAHTMVSTSRIRDVIEKETLATISAGRLRGEQLENFLHSTVG